MTEKLAGKSAFVTGGSRGIGAAVVQRLAAEGAQVAFTYLQSDDRAEEVTRQVAESGGRALALRADNGDPAAIRAAVAEAARAFGSLDILVNSVYYYAPAPIESFPLSEFERTVDVTLRGTFITTQEAVSHMDGEGRIINIGSVFAERTPPLPDSGIFVYQMVKSALQGFTRGLARELGPRGITVNSVHPFSTSTGGLPPGWKETMASLTPLGRIAAPADIASAVAYLASPEAHFVTGVNWNVDGGYTA